MTERERLVRIINDINIWELVEDDGNSLTFNNDLLADKLLDNGVIVLPCKVGDKVYYIDAIYNYGTLLWDIFEGKVENVSIENDGLWVYCSYNDGLNLWHNITDDLNRLVFLNRKEAEKALKEREIK